MNAELNKVLWRDVEKAAAKMFHVWVGDGEIIWVRECWLYFDKAGLTNSATALDRTLTYLRLVTLACVYEEFCGLAWDENPGTPIDYLAEDLEIDPVALGVLAAKISPDNFDELTDEHELLNEALRIVTEFQRKEIFDCLSKAYGSDVQLYSRISRTKQSADDEDDDEIFRETYSNSITLNFIMNGFQQG